MAQAKTNPTRRWLLLALLALLLVVWAVGMASGQSVSLQREAVLDANEVSAAGGVTLGMVTDLEGFGTAEANVLGSLVVLADDARPRQVTLPHIREALRMAGVNLGLLSLRGFAVCDIRLDAASQYPQGVEAMEAMLAPSLAPELSENQRESDGSDVAMPVNPVDVVEAATLGELIETKLRGALDLPADQVVCVFDGRDAATLNQSTLGVIFEIEPVGDVRLGRMNIRVSRTAGFGKPVRENIGVRIGWKTHIVTATRDIAKHERLNESNLRLTEVTIDRNLDGELFNLGSARGAVASSSLRLGDPVRTEDLGRPMLVKRGQMVTVLVRRGGFEMTTTGYAEHDAALHEPVTLRSDARRTRETQTFRAYVAGPGKVSVTSLNPVITQENTQLAQGS